MSDLTQEDWERWTSNPVTEEFFRRITATRAELVEILISTDDLTQAAKLRGQLQLLSELPERAKE